jgi:hypothetical protein
MRITAGQALHQRHSLALVVELHGVRMQAHPQLATDQPRADRV